MKLKCDRKQLNTLLSLAKKAVPNRSIIPETACVLLSAQNGVLSIKSTDTTIAFSLQMDAEMTGEGTLCVPAETLSGKSTGPGRTALTRTLGASSTANMRVRVGIAPLEMK